MQPPRPPQLCEAGVGPLRRELQPQQQASAAAGREERGSELAGTTDRPPCPCTSPDSRADTRRTSLGSSSLCLRPLQATFLSRPARLHVAQTPLCCLPGPARTHAPHGRSPPNRPLARETAHSSTRLLPPALPRLPRLPSQLRSPARMRTPVRPRPARSTTVARPHRSRPRPPDRPDLGRARCSLAYRTLQAPWLLLGLTRRPSHPSAQGGLSDLSAGAHGRPQAAGLCHLLGAQGQVLGGASAVPAGSGEATGGGEARQCRRSVASGRHSRGGRRGRASKSLGAGPARSHGGQGGERATAGRGKVLRGMSGGGEKWARRSGGRQFRGGGTGAAEAPDGVGG